MPGLKAAKEIIKDGSLCCHGCGSIAGFITKHNNKLCSPFANQCPVVKERNGKSVKASGIDYANRYDRLSADAKKRMAWSKGLTIDDPRVAKRSAKLRGRRRITDSERLRKKKYRENCEFNLQSNISKVEGYVLLKELGMYDRIKNPSGVVRDHIISVDFGFKNNIPPEIISHPANCRFITHLENAKKGKRSDLLLNDLINRIEKWGIDGNW